MEKSKLFSGFYKQVIETSKKQIKLNHSKSLIYIFTRLGNIGIILISALYGGYMVINDVMNLSDVFALFIILPKISDSIFKIPSIIADFRILDGLGKKLKKYMIWKHMSLGIRIIN